jgi:hypothetical protein
MNGLKVKDMVAGGTAHYYKCVLILLYTCPGLRTASAREKKTAVARTGMY